MFNKKIIAEYTDYVIYDTGIIKSLKHNKIILLKYVLDRYGYPIICLSTNGKSKTFKIHRLVAQTFIPNPDNKPQVNHKDGNKQNNRVDNLEWVTRKENEKHAVENGLKGHKLLENDVLAIHGLYLSGMTRKEIGLIYGVTDTHIYYIVNGLTWKYLI